MQAQQVTSYVLVYLSNRQGHGSGSVTMLLLGLLTTGQNSEVCGTTFSKAVAMAWPHSVDKGLNFQIFPNGFYFYHPSPICVKGRKNIN